MTDNGSMSRKERQAKAEAKRQEVCNIIILGIQDKITETQDIGAGFQYGDQLINAMLRKKPQERSIIMDGVDRALKTLREALVDQKDSGVNH
jgi:hypothetical protein